MGGVSLCVGVCVYVNACPYVFDAVGLTEEHAHTEQVLNTEFIS